MTDRLKDRLKINHQILSVKNRNKDPDREYIAAVWTYTEQIYNAHISVNTLKYNNK